MTELPTTPAATPRRGPPDLREVITDALRYWEKQRLLYNAILAAVVVVVGLTAGGPGQLVEHPDRLVILAFNAVMANLCFCAAYVPDVFVQLSDFRAAWRRYRWILMAAGTLPSALVASFVAHVLFR